MEFELFGEKYKLPSTFLEWLQVVSDVLGWMGAGVVAYTTFLTAEDRLLFAIGLSLCVASGFMEGNTPMGIAQLVFTIPIYLIGENHIAIPQWIPFFYDKGNTLATLCVILAFINFPILFEILGGFFRWLGKGGRSMRKTFKEIQPKE